MTRTNRTATALGGATLAALAIALPGQASANGELACDGASYTGYPAGPVEGVLRLEVDGATFASARVAIAPPRTTVPLAYKLTGTHTIALYFDGYGAPLLVAGPVILSCGPTPAPVPPGEPAPSTPGAVVTPPSITPPTTSVKEGGVKEPSRTRAPSTRWRVTSTRCRIYARPPANAVPASRVPRLGQVRVRRDDAGRWAGFADRHRVTWVNGKIDRVVFIPGAFCGRIVPAVAG